MGKQRATRGVKHSMSPFSAPQSSKLCAITKAKYGPLRAGWNLHTVDPDWKCYLLASYLCVDCSVDACYLIFELITSCWVLFECPPMDGMSLRNFVALSSKSSQSHE